MSHHSSRHPFMFMHHGHAGNRYAIAPSPPRTRYHSPLFKIRPVKHCVAIYAAHRIIPERIERAILTLRAIRQMPQTCSRCCYYVSASRVWVTSPMSCTHHVTLSYVENSLPQFLHRLRLWFRSPMLCRVRVTLVSAQLHFGHLTPWSSPSPW